MRVDDVAGNGPGSLCPPRHIKLLTSTNEGSKYELMTRRKWAWQTLLTTSWSAISFNKLWSTRACQ
jgi:hypothetical protein